MYGIGKTNNNSPIIPFHKGDEDNKINIAIKKAKCEFIYDLED
jgi:hypothetical protein